MLRTLLIGLISFVVGAVTASAPFLISAHFAHLDETARGEQTMGPGITTGLGLLAAPVGGIVALSIAMVVVLIRARIRKAKQKLD